MIQLPLREIEFSVGEFNEYQGSHIDIVVDDINNNDCIHLRECT